VYTYTQYTLLSLYTLSNAYVDICLYTCTIRYIPLWTWNGWIAMGSAIYDMMLKIYLRFVAHLCQIASVNQATRVNIGADNMYIII